MEAQLNSNSWKKIADKDYTDIHSQVALKFDQTHCGLVSNQYQLFVKVTLKRYFESAIYLNISYPHSMSKWPGAYYLRDTGILQRAFVRYLQSLTIELELITEMFMFQFKIGLDTTRKAVDPHHTENHFQKSKNVKQKHV